MDAKEIKRLNNNLEKFNENLENDKLRDYISANIDKKKIFFNNFISGIAKGLGYAVGFSFLSGLLLYIISTTIDIPIIGKYIAQFMDLIEAYRIK